MRCGVPCPGHFWTRYRRTQTRNFSQDFIKPRALELTRKPAPHHPVPLNRRRFLTTVATGSLAAQLTSKFASAATNPPAPPATPAAASEVTAGTLEAAEKIAGFSFTPAQREPILKSVADRTAAYKALRASPIPNHVFPTLTFDPRIAGVFPPPGSVERMAATRPADGIARPASDEDLAFLSLAELGALLRARKITSRELTELALARLRKYDGVLQAVINFTEERALRQADAADAELKAGKWRSLLHGIPWGAKDLLSVRGYPTTWGATQFKDQRFDEDAAVVQRLDAAGAVLVAKLSLGALANNDRWFGGQTKCPWNIERGSSGSSAGPCAAVAAGLVPFAIGSETLGSIVSPCTRNGVTGLRPTYGRVSRAGAMALAWSTDKIGPIARSAADCALVFDVIHGVDAGDPTTVDAPFAWPPHSGLKGERIGYLADVFAVAGEWHDANQGVLATLKEAGAELVPIALPVVSLPAIRIIYDVEMAAAFDDFTLSGEVDVLLAPHPSNWANTMRAARYIPAVEYVQANRLRTLMIRELEQTLADAKIDVWVSPPVPGPSPNLFITNLTGHPTVCVPAGFIPVPDQPADSPRRNAGSTTFNARLYRDDRALAVAHAFQQATDWHRRRPPIA